MEYNYELLRKCDGLRFKAELYESPNEGVIKVDEDCVYLCYGNEVPRPELYNRKKALKVLEGQPLNCGRISHFEILPRDPEKYTDWQVGDVICGCAGNSEIIFRCGEVVVFKHPNGEAGSIYTCRELFEAGYRLVRSDVEEMIWRKQNWEKFHPSDGDIIYLNFGDGRKGIMVFESLDENKDVIRGYVSVSTITGEVRIGKQLTGEFLRSVKSYRYADTSDKEYFFEKLAENGKRWNAETKIVEDIEPERNEPVDVQKMIAYALEGYVPKGSIEGFPLEVVAKMLERQYEQSGKIDLSNFERNRVSVAPLGFDWTKTEEGTEFWKSVICWRDFSEFFKRYPKDASTGDSHTFREGEPVLVRNYDNWDWYLAVFSKKIEDVDHPYEILDSYGNSHCYRKCIPYNEKTRHLLGTSDNYKEE